jgi:hypothetical protein
MTYQGFCNVGFGLRLFPNPQALRPNRDDPNRRIMASEIVRFA